MVDLSVFDSTINVIYSVQILVGDSNDGTTNHIIDPCDDDRARARDRDDDDDDDHDHDHDHYHDHDDGGDDGGDGKNKLNMIS